MLTRECGLTSPVDCYGAATTLPRSLESVQCEWGAMLVPFIPNVDVILGFLFIRTLHEEYVIPGALLSALRTL